MRKKRKYEENDNPDRWVVSYADFITLLFAFFTTLYAISHVDQGKLEQFSGSMRTAFKATPNELLDTTVINGIKPANFIDITLEKKLQEEVNKFSIIEGIVIARDGRGVIVSFGDTLLFESGDAAVKKTARPLLAFISEFARKTGRSVIIEGHTDNLPLRGTRYVSNMELSAARAASVFSVLLADHIGNPDRLSTAGYGEYRPVASNATFEGRARNRRVDIIFVTGEDPA